jgi:hypothetical protein
MACVGRHVDTCEEVLKRRPVYRFRLSAVIENPTYQLSQVLDEGLTGALRLAGPHESLCKIRLERKSSVLGKTRADDEENFVGGGRHSISNIS